MCHISPLVEGTLFGILFLLEERMEAVEPGSILGLVSDCMVSCMVLNLDMFLSSLSGWRNPIDWRSDSFVIDTALGKAELTLLEDEGVNRDVGVLSLIFGNGG
jgi:hypothetical protein